MGIKITIIQETWLKIELNSTKNPIGNRTYERCIIFTVSLKEFERFQ
jgi:hypothetical protein